MLAYSKHSTTILKLVLTEISLKKEKKSSLIEIVFTSLVQRSIRNNPSHYILNVKSICINNIICDLPISVPKKKKKDSPMSFGDTFKVLFWKILNIC